jgi:thiamine pyrophosphate-dependent acetolactate synthase large subunit-like protein
MSNTLTLLDRTPDWIEALCREIDTLKFASAFDTFTPDAILAFGVKQITGASARALASGKPAILHCIVDPQALTPSQTLDAIRKQGEEA